MPLEQVEPIAAGDDRYREIIGHLAGLIRERAPLRCPGCDAEYQLGASTFVLDGRRYVRVESDCRDLCLEADVAERMG